MALLARPSVQRSASRPEAGGAVPCLSEGLLRLAPLAGCDTAGYGGLPKSMAYGPTKAALINLAETLYLDLHNKNIGVSLICPGFVDTPLTAQNKFNMPALITPDEAAQEILKGWANGEFEIHFPKRFTQWMKAIKMLPYRLYFPAIKKFTGL